MLLAQGTFSQSVSVTGAKLLTMPEYVLPPEAVAAGIDGQVAVIVWVNKDGSVDRAEAYAGPYWPCGSNPKREIENVRDGVVETMKRAKFAPELKDGKPQNAEMLMTVLIGEAYKHAKEMRAAKDKSKVNWTEPTGGEVINGKAVSLPKPEYPTVAQVNRIFGTVEIQVLIDENGKVLQAGVKTGNPKLQMAARDAACKATFSTTLFNGKPVKVSGIIVYNFAP